MAGAKEKEFKLPRYLKLGRGAMWLDVEGDEASGVKLYAADTAFVGRGSYPSDNAIKATKSKTGAGVDIPEVPKDKFGNMNFVDYGFVDKLDLPWYVDTKDIPTEKLSKVILAYKHGILVEADPKKPPTKPEVEPQVKEFTYNNKGERVFVGQNKEMYKRLQNLKFEELRQFVLSSPRNDTSKNNLIDLYHYEQKGYNRLARARLEVLDMIRAKLKEFGPSMSAIRVNDID